MSTSSSSQRISRRLGKFDINDLKCIKVAIRRSNIKSNEQTSPVPILRSIEEPERLIKVIHYRSDEGLHPIFDRDDIHINKTEDVIEKWVCKCGGEQKLLRITPDKNKINSNQSKDLHDYYARSKSSVRRSRSRSYDNYKTHRRSISPPPPSSASRHHKSNRYSRSSPPSTHRYDDKHLRKSRTPPPSSSSTTTIKDYRNKRGRSVEDYRELSKKSPSRYKHRSPDRDRKRSRSPPLPLPSHRRDDDDDDRRSHKSRYSSRSPPPPPQSSSSRHRRSPHLRETRRSRSPPVYRSRRTRSRERRYSRSPPPPPSSSSTLRRYEKRNSRSPTSRHVSRYYSSPPHRSRSSRSPSKRDYKNVQIPEIQYYPGEEYWIPGPMPPRFIPRGFIPPPTPLPPPGVYPRGPGLIPRGPILIPPFHPQQPYRQRYPVYNNRIIQPQKSKTVTTSTATTTIANVAAAAAITTISSSSNNNNNCTTTSIVTSSVITSTAASSLTQQDVTGIVISNANENINENMVVVSSSPKNYDNENKDNE